MARIQCVACAGSGKVPWRDAAGPWAGRTEKACPVCNGRGTHEPGAELGNRNGRR